ncbi:MAG: CapA family protein [Bacteroidota bacterium]
MSVTVNIAGDFCIEPAYIGSNLLSQEIKEVYQKADINIVNLECPVNKNGDRYKIVKHGPHLQTTDKIFDYLRQLNITAVTLANNHLLDYGVQALETTLEECKKNKIFSVGAGRTLAEAGKHVVIEKNNTRIALVNICEHEWSIATDETAGANPLDIIENLSQVKEAKKSADFVLVIFHGGHEYYHLPSPRIKKLFRFFADNGADAIISHHTHCISGYEVYNKVPILYGVGNMLFTRKNNFPGWLTGLTAQLVLEKAQPIQFSLIPTHQSAGEYVLSVSEGNDKETVLKDIEQFSSIIADDNKLKNEWTALVEKRSPLYLYAFSAVPAMPGRYVRSSLRRLGFVDKFLSKRYLAGVINYFTCQSHHDIAIQVLKKKLLKK